MPVCWIIAGPNGAGKTTFALESLEQVAGCRHFINADLIAAGLNPLEPGSELMAASRLFLREIADAIEAKKVFAFETTLSGRGHLRTIGRLRSQGWRVELIYLALPSVEISKLRVAERVASGGHDVPVADLERRFPRSLRNLLGPYSRAADRTRCLMNDGESPRVVFEQSGEERVVHDENLYRLMEEQSVL